jgi:UDPglucose--hexose-1-phosphate uridylyltransferase
MPEFRKDPFVDRWVIISTERAKRPVGYGSSGEVSDAGECPFCAGHEAMTPPEILVLRSESEAPNSPQWSVRVVPNKYPALVRDGSGTQIVNELYAAEAGIGAHEVIIESPSHVTDMALLSDKQFETILRAYSDRITDLRGDRKLRCVLIYKNQGPEAGATLEHVHSQLVALPMVPKQLREEIGAAKTYYESKKRCVFCAVIGNETKGHERFVVENDRFIVVCPFAPRFPYETWILPKRHASFFERNSQQDQRDLARILREILRRFKHWLSNPPFNYVIHSNPLDQDGNDYYHWHIEILPKLIQVGGFEWGSGFYINTVTPEQSAGLLRQPLS